MGYHPFHYDAGSFPKQGGYLILSPAKNVAKTSGFPQLSNRGEGTIKPFHPDLFFIWMQKLRREEDLRGKSGY